MTTSTETRTGIFFSHATKDKDVTNAFVEKILILGMGVDSDSIFNVSDVDHGVPTGHYFVPYIREKITKSAVVIAWITPRYVESSFCMCELGAAWALLPEKLPFFPLIDDMTFGQLPGALIGMQALKASDKAIIDKFGDELAEALRIQNRPKTATWNRHRDDFFEAYTTKKSTPTAELPKTSTGKGLTLKRIKALANSLRTSEGQKATMPFISPEQANQFNTFLQEAKQAGVDTRLTLLPTNKGGFGAHFGTTETPLPALIANLEMLAAELEE